ncbi:MAG: hypothetical protein U0802_14415 [Candidatus Binatia bacterium]
MLPADTLDAIVHHGVALKGPCTTPVGEGFVSVNVQRCARSCCCTRRCGRCATWPA